MADVRHEYETGRVVSVDLVSLGDNLAADASSGASSITVEDAADFDEDGGQLLLGGVVYGYGAVDDDTGVITLTDTLTAAAEEGDAVHVYDTLYLTAATEKVAQVEVVGDDGNVDTLETAIAQHLVDALEEGIRGLTGESVRLELDDDQWTIVDVLGAANVGTVRFTQDSFTLASDGNQDVELTYLPTLNSEHVYWNGLYQREGVSWSRVDKTVSLLGGGALTDDVIDIEYAYLDGGTHPQAFEQETFYLQSAGAPPVSPAVDALWDLSTDVRRTMGTSPADTDSLSQQATESVSGAVDVMACQFVGPDNLTAGTRQGSFRTVLVARESSGDAEMFLNMVIKIVSGDGSTVRGVLYAGQGTHTASGTSTSPQYEFSTALDGRTRTLAGSLSPVVAQAGDRLVVEYGYSDDNLNTTGRVGILRFGDRAEDADLPYEVDFDGDNGYRPWIEFTWS